MPLHNFPDVVNRAHSAVAIALRNGTLKRSPACSNCGKACLTNAHHHDYEKPLSVVWLCDSCHGLLHRMAHTRARDKYRDAKGDDQYPTPMQIERHRWIRANPGITLRIAKTCGVSRPMVSRVLHEWCNSYEGNVERELERLNAPGWVAKKGQGKA